jgi:probable HAF family extracellular repeat protein
MGDFATGEWGVSVTEHGFFRAADGSITTIDGPGATNTFATGINNRGAVTGSFYDSNGTAHGYVWVAGTMTTFDPPGSTGTFAYGINNIGTIAGYYWDSSGGIHGFVRTR